MTSTPTNIRIPEQEKKPGLCYAVTADGVELPVVDVTHPAFELEVPDKTGLEAMIAQAVDQQAKANRLPAIIRRPLFWLMARRSVLMRGILGADGHFLNGMTTYLMKLGPDNLGSGYAGALDRTIAAALPGLSVRLRLRDAAGLLAGALAPRLAHRPRATLGIISIAGGPCSDALNTLILLRRDHPDLLADRPVLIQVYDLDRAGPAFAARALEALRAPGAPLEGLDASLRRRPYDWAAPSQLRTYLAEFGSRDAVVAACSEGGLGDYGTDQIIQANLQALHAGTPDDTVLMLSITPADSPAAVFNKHTVARTIPRSLASFTALAARSGWSVVETRDQPLDIVVGLRKEWA